MADQTSGRPVVSIQIDSTDFDAFLAKFREYQASLGEQPDKWAAVGQEISTVGTEFEKTAMAFGKIGDAAGDNRVNQFFLVATKQTREVEHSSSRIASAWHAIGKDLEKSSKMLTSFARGSFGISNLGLFGAVAGTVGAVAGASIAASGSLAEKNLESRSLGLQVGDVETFEADFGKFGLGKSDLQTVADAQQDQRKWLPFISAGLSTQDIQNLNPEQLLTKFDELASQKYGEWQREGRPAGAMAEAYGFNSILSNSQLRTGASYEPSAFDDAAASYSRDSERARVDRSTADQATQSTAQLRAALEADANAVEAALSGLSPAIAKVADRFTDTVVAFAKSGELKADIDEVVTAFDAVAKAGDWLAGKLNALFPKDAGQQHDLSFKGGGFGAKAFDYWDSLVDAYHGKQHIDESGRNIHFDFHWPWSSNPAPDQTKFSPTVEKALPIISKIESHDDPWALNKKSGAAGQYQLMPATASSFGVDPYDPKAAREAAGTLLTKNLEQWHGDLAKALAQYDGDTHIAADMKKYDGDWIKGAKPETLKYLQRAEDSGLDLGLSAQDKRYISDQIAKHMKAPAVQSMPDVNQPVFHMPTQQTNQTGQMAPIKIDLNVSAPAGSNVNYSVGGLAQ